VGGRPIGRLSCLQIKNQTGVVVEGEIWRDVPSVPGILVSSEGRVMHVPHREPMPNGGERPYGGTPVFGVWNKQDGRFIILIHGKTYKVGRLVAEAFHGPPPFDDAVVMHIDENAVNNRPSNLRWGTQKENLNAGGFLTYCHGRTGENSPTIKGRRRAEQQQ
jgi:HNH endonuclease